MIVSLTLLLTIFTPGVLGGWPFPDYSPDDLRRFERGQPPFAQGHRNYGYGSNNKNHEHGPMPFGQDHYGHGGHGDENHGHGDGNRGHGYGNRGHGYGNRGHGYGNHGYGNGNHGYGNRDHGHGHKNQYPHSSEECDSDYDHTEHTHTKRPPTKPTPLTTITILRPSTKPTPLTTVTTPSTKNFGGGLIDVRFKEDDRSKRSKGTDPSTMELKSRRQNSLGFQPSFYNSDYDYPFFPPRLSTCVQKKFDCVRIHECKSPPRRDIDFEFCKWGHDEPYVCCEKAKKVKNAQNKCGKRKTTEFSQALIGGVAVEKGIGFPWMVAVGETAANDSVDWYCGGALIGEKTVVTAAHCVARRTANMIRIGEIDLTVDKNNSESNMQQISVCRTLIHPLYRSPLLYNDIALLYLEEPVEFTQFAEPICLAQKTSVSETPIALLTGWGQLSFATERSSILQEVSLKVFNNSYCDEQYAITQASKRFFPRGILDTQLCAGDEAGGKDACQGDSGAPLVTNENGAFVLIGLVSAGIGCGSQTFPGVYSRISAFTPWILENTL